MRLRKQKEGKADEEEGEPEGLFGFVVEGRGSIGGPGEGVG